MTVDNEYNDLENAIADLATMHVSYLNAEHDPEVLSKWKNSVYTGSDIFSGVNGFDYMSAHLGYRYRLKTSSLAFRSLLDDTARLYLTIENTGFSFRLPDLRNHAGSEKRKYRRIGRPGNKHR